MQPIVPILLVAALAACASVPEEEATTTMPPSRLIASDLPALAPPSVDACSAPPRWRPLTVVPATPPGRTRERWRGEACGQVQLVNLVVDEATPGVLAVTVLLPGTTRATPQAQQAASLQVLGRVPDPDCRERWVVDTRPTGDGGAGGAAELWTVRSCDRLHQFRLAFAAPDAPRIERIAGAGAR